MRPVHLHSGLRLALPYALPIVFPETMVLFLGYRIPDQFSIFDPTFERFEDETTSFITVDFKYNSWYYEFT